MNHINGKVHELRVRKTKLATILTGISSSLNVPTEVQLLSVNEWDLSAGRVIVHTAFQMPAKQSNGVRIAATKATDPSVADVLRAYIVQIPGDEIFGIAAANVKFNGPQIELFAHVEKEKMERAWACHMTSDTGGIPLAFIMSAPVLPHILRDIPNTLTFGNPSWATWMDSWLSRFMLKHRYFSADQFKLISPITTTPDEVISAFDYKIEPDPVPAPVADTTAQPEKRKPGRPKKQVTLDEVVSF